MHRPITSGVVAVWHIARSCVADGDLDRLMRRWRALIPAAAQADRPGWSCNRGRDGGTGVVAARRSAVVSMAVARS